MLHPQPWLLHIQVTSNRQHHSNTHHNSTNHNRTHQHTKFHLHMKCHSSSIQWVMIKQNSLRMKLFERQIQVYDKHICKFFICVLDLRCLHCFLEMKVFIKNVFFINICLANVPMWNPLRTPENRGYKMGTWARNW